MIKTIGRVIEVFIPEQYKNGNLLDVMDRTNIGFKVVTNNSMRDIIVEQNELNAKIMKNDLVTIEAGYEYEVTVTYKGDDDSDTISSIQTALKIDGKWYSLDAMGVLSAMVE